MLTVVVLGASGATGKLVVAQLLKRQIRVRAIVRRKESLSKFSQLHDFADNVDGNENNEASQLTIIEASIADLTVEECAKHLSSCDAVVSCLGHNLSFTGIWGKPRRLVTDAIGKVAQASALLANTNTGPQKIVLMNTTGNANRDIPETPPLSQRIVVFLLRYLIPPHADNEHAADYLRVNLRHDDLKWVVVRPDTLIDHETVTEYDFFESPIRNVIFNAGKTSRINVAHFMAELLTKDELWNTWQGKMPVIYN